MKNSPWKMEEPNWTNTIYTRLWCSRTYLSPIRSTIVKTSSPNQQRSCCYCDEIFCWEERERERCSRQPKTNLVAELTSCFCVLTERQARRRDGSCGEREPTKRRPFVMVLDDKRTSKYSKFHSCTHCAIRSKFWRRLPA